MPITRVSTDYSTRTKDIHIFQGVNASKLSDITPGFGRISNYCSGVQKLIQRYTISLLTELGSQTYYPDFGTELISSLLNSSSSLNRLDVGLLFNEANVKVITAFRDHQRESTGIPLDEQLDTALLTNVSVYGGTVGLTIQLYTAAGVPIEFLIPLPSIS